MAVDVNIFKGITALVIDKLEGGYYHPLMLADGRVKDQRYANSGETMFGIDRKAGGRINLTPSGVLFWKAIDDANAKTLWKWNYKGGALAKQLKVYVGNIMLPEYEALAKRYLSPNARDIVNSDKRLLFNFIYATWNGSGWFQKFASDFSSAVAKGITDPNQLVQVAIESRTKEGLRAGSPPNSLIKQGGEKIALFINDIE